MMYEEKTHAFKTFNSDLKQGNIANLVVFHGNEEYLIEWASSVLIDRFVEPSMKEMDYVKLNEDALIPDILEACNTFSMFSNKRVVWVKDAAFLKNQKAKGYTKEDGEKLLKYAREPNDGTILILSSSELDQKSDLIKELKKVVPFYDFSTLDEQTLFAFIEKRFKTEGVTISRDNIKLFISESGYLNKESDYKLFNAINDIKKISAHSEKEVTENDILKTLDGDLETFVFDFLDAISLNKKEIAFNMLNNILSSDGDIFKVLGVLINHFELILEVLEFKNDGYTLLQMKDILKIHEFRIKKALSFADRFTIDKLKEVLIELYSVDRKVKTGDMEASLALELIVANI